MCWLDRQVRTRNHARAPTRRYRQGKAEGLYKGRKPTAQQHEDKIIARHKQGIGVAAILKAIRSMEDKVGRVDRRRGGPHVDRDQLWRWLMPQVSSSFFRFKGKPPREQRSTAAV